MTEAHTLGPLTVRVCTYWPYDIETINAEGVIVFSDGMPAHSSAMNSLEDLWFGVGFPAHDKAAVIAANRRAVADAVIRAAAPCLLEALKRARRYVADLPIVGDADLAVIDAAILKATTRTSHD